jgi:hypothetical protein
MASTRSRFSEPSVTFRIFSGRLFITCWPAGASRSKPHLVAMTTLSWYGSRAEDLNGLSVFVAVAEEKGFRAAGRRLGVSGSTVSQSIDRLEERLGVAVFERTTGRYASPRRGSAYTPACAPRSGSCCRWRRT